MNDDKNPLTEDQVSQLLKKAARPQAPTDMLAKVRARLVEEKAQQLAGGDASAPLDDVPHPATIEATSAPAARSFWRAWAVEGAVVAAAAVAVVIGLSVGDTLPVSRSQGAQAAGVAGEADAQDVEVRVSLAAADVRKLAAEHGLQVVGDATGATVVVEAERAVAQRFLVQLRVAASRAGGEVKGFVPDAKKLRLTILTQP
jgi:hypothetical protein